jgi:hypothetical protein
MANRKGRPATRQQHELLPLSLSAVEEGGANNKQEGSGTSTRRRVATAKKRKKTSTGDQQEKTPEKPIGRPSTKRTKISLGSRRIVADSPASILETLGNTSREKRRSGPDMDVYDRDNNHGSEDGSTSSSCSSTTGHINLDCVNGSKLDNHGNVSAFSRNNEDDDDNDDDYDYDNDEEGEINHDNNEDDNDDEQEEGDDTIDDDDDDGQVYAKDNNQVEHRNGNHVAAAASHQRERAASSWSQSTGMHTIVASTKRHQHPDRKQHVCDRIQLYVKTHLFRKVKFIKDENMLMELMAVVEQTEKFRDQRSRDAFKSIYKGVVMEAINIRRSACDQAGGRIVEQYLSSNLATMTDGGCNNGSAPLNIENLSFFNLEKFCKLRRAHSEDEVKAFNWFFGEFMDCVSGKRVWSRHKYHALISEAVNRDTGVQIITVSDEAFGLLLLENYMEKWKRRFVAKANGVVLEKKLDGKYTASTKGNFVFGGWSKAGQKQFNFYVNMVKADRAGAGARQMEFNFLSHMQRTPIGQKIYEKMQLKMSAAERRGGDSADESDCDVYIEPL